MSEPNDDGFSEIIRDMAMETFNVSEAEAQKFADSVEEKIDEMEERAEQEAKDNPSGGCNCFEDCTCNSDPCGCNPCKNGCCCTCCPDEACV